MALYPISDKFVESTHMFETSTSAHANILNSIFNLLLNNDNFLNKMIEEIKTTLSEMAEEVDNIELTDESISVNSDKFKSDILHEVLEELYTLANHAHAAEKITESASKRFVSDTEKSTWNAKASTAVATTGANGLMPAADKAKLNGIATNANNYTHPATHPPSILSAGTLTAAITALNTVPNTTSAIRNIRMGSGAVPTLANNEIFIRHE